MPDLPINREALLHQVNILVSEIAFNAYNVGKQGRDLEEFRLSANKKQVSITRLIDSYAASLVEENKKHSPDWHYSHTEACFKNFSRYCTCGADAKNKQRAPLLGRLSEEEK